MLYGAAIVAGLFAAEFTLQLTSSIASDAVVSMFQNYAWQPPIEDPETQMPSDIITALEITE